MNMSVISLQEYEFEKHFDERGAIAWMQENWSKSFLFSAVYAALIFAGQYYMRERRKFELRKPLVLWSLSLALFSILGAFRTGWYMWHVLYTSGFKQSVCDQSFYNGPVSKFWAYAFVLSKAPELAHRTAAAKLTNFTTHAGDNKPDSNSDGLGWISRLSSLSCIIPGANVSRKKVSRAVRNTSCSSKSTHTTTMEEAPEPEVVSPAKEKDPPCYDRHQKTSTANRTI
ncbi:very long chain fatty acid elongase 6-like isoform X2 [Hemitrygon akajei]|uniref:very long chain fatty acid elongase 6-like isoform X2 n=1 Tax=Hemitrygon akajei TaxID=2704970 RepID=UPI003BFA1615